MYIYIYACIKRERKRENNNNSNDNNINDCNNNHDNNNHDNNDINQVDELTTTRTSFPLFAFLPLSLFLSSLLSFLFLFLFLSFKSEIFTLSYSKKK